MYNFLKNKINTDLDNYYLNPYKFINNVNINSNSNSNLNLCIDTNDDLNTIIQTLTSIIMSNKEINHLKNNQIRFNTDIDLDQKNKQNINASKEVYPLKSFENFRATNNKFDDHDLFKFIANNNLKQLEVIFNNYKSININIQDEDGDTPLHLSVFLCNFEICEILLLNKALLNIKDKWGQIPIHRLCFCSGDPDAIKIINLFNIYQKKNNFNFNIFNFVDNYGNTSFHLILNYFIKNNVVINKNHLKIINKLKKITDNKITNKNNQSIIDLLNILNI